MRYEGDSPYMQPRPPSKVRVEMEQQREATESKSSLENVEENVASFRSTLAALDDLDERWKNVQKRFAEALKLSLQSAFGIEAPCSLTDEEKAAVLGGKPTIEELCKRLRGGSFKKVVMMVGAGVSVAAGIPDFRSPGTGLYDNLKSYNLPTPQAVFEIDFFHKDPRPFFALAKELYPGRFKPTPAHYFIRLLEDKGYLLRCYTQNIDTLERLAGVPAESLVEAHGSFAKAWCTNSSCRKEYDAHEMREAIFSDDVPTCVSCGAVVKPGVVFFGEELPERFKTLYEGDLAQCDLLVVMGTSLQVQPFARLICQVKQTTPRLLINRDRVGSLTLASEGGYRDVALLEDCDAAVKKICNLCGWRDELEKLAGGQDTSIKAAQKCH